MSALSECTTTVAKLQQLVQTNSAAIPDDKLENLYQPVLEGQGLCPCGDGGRGGDAIA